MLKKKELEVVALKRKVTELEENNKRLKFENAFLRRKSNQCEMEIKVQIFSKLSPQHAIILRNCLHNFSRAKRGQRYDNELKTFALSILYLNFLLNM